MQKELTCLHNIKCNCGNISAVVIKEHSIANIKGSHFNNLKQFDREKSVFSIHQQALRISEFEDVSVSCFSNKIFEITCLECGTRILFLNTGEKGIIQISEPDPMHISEKHIQENSLNKYFPFQLRPYISLIKSQINHVHPSRSSSEILLEGHQKKKNVNLLSAPYGKRMSSGVLY